MVVEVKQTKFNRDNPKFIDLANTVYKVIATSQLSPFLILLLMPRLDVVSMSRNRYA